MQKRFTLNDAVHNFCRTAARVAGYDYFAFCSPGVPLRSTPGFMQSSASRTDFASMIRQVCDYGTKDSDLMRIETRTPPNREQTSINSDLLQGRTNSSKRKRLG